MRRPTKVATPIIQPLLRPNGKELPSRIKLTITILTAKKTQGQDHHCATISTKLPKRDNISISQDMAWQGAVQLESTSISSHLSNRTLECIVHLLQEFLNTKNFSSVSCKLKSMSSRIGKETMELCVINLGISLSNTNKHKLKRTGSNMIVWTKLAWTDKKLIGSLENSTSANRRICKRKRNRSGWLKISHRLREMLMLPRLISIGLDKIVAYKTNKIWIWERRMSTKKNYAMNKKKFLTKITKRFQDWEKCRLSLRKTWIRSIRGCKFLILRLKIIIRGLRVRTLWSTIRLILSIKSMIR